MRRCCLTILYPVPSWNHGAHAVSNDTSKSHWPMLPKLRQTSRQQSALAPRPFFLCKTLVIAPIGAEHLDYNGTMRSCPRSFGRGLENWKRLFVAAPKSRCYDADADWPSIVQAKWCRAEPDKSVVSSGLRSTSSRLGYGGCKPSSVAHAFKPMDIARIHVTGCRVPDER